MQRRILVLIFCFVIFFPVTQAKEIPVVYIDKNGVMRWEDTRREASFFGVNYTLPFAHAYRAMGYLNVDRKAAIDRDVYHFVRLGFNAYRIHIWDVEISDIDGNLIENDHLDLLDYLIYKLKERDIHIVLTAMTNFGNGYPERNQPTGGFSYAYDKCEIHTNPEAIRAQERYIASLAVHVNPYTGKAYKDDPSVVGFEINNEPCHADTQQQTRDYINRMLAALDKAVNRKPLFYNVSHNMQQIEAYYAADIQGTTYQWYPVGLVSGYTRKGNFLPYVDDFHIPFSHVKGFGNKTRLVYEYDPADIMYSYVHPAMVRTFRTAGFQWITQFAYDPVDMAWANTEYQTHFLNLAYTPQKAISMKIAAEVAYTVPRGQSYGIYPADTLFADFAVSYTRDLSVMNTKEKYFYSNHTAIPPVDAAVLKSVAGYGHSPIVQYEGTGAYFIDRLEAGVWRLEVMPDAVPVSDPFAKPSLRREVVTIAWKVFPNAKVIVHLHGGDNNELYRWLFDGLKDNGGKWDVIGMSLYPATDSWQQTNADCMANIQDMIGRYDSEVMICEVGMPWDEAEACRDFLTDLIAKAKAIEDDQCLGVFYWEPQSYGGWKEYTLGTFDENGHPTVALDAFKF